MSFLSVPIFRMIATCMPKCDPKYGAAAAIFPEIVSNFSLSKQFCDAKSEIDREFEKSIAAASEAIKSCPFDIV